MNFNKHYSLEGKHAFLGASKYHWINYDEDKLINSYTKYQATYKQLSKHDFIALIASKTLTNEDATIVKSNGQYYSASKENLILLKTLDPLDTKIYIEKEETFIKNSHKL